MLSYSGILDLSNGSISSGLFQLTPFPKNNDSKKYSFTFLNMFGQVLVEKIRNQITAFEATKKLPHRAFK